MKKIITLLLATGLFWGAITQTAQAETQFDVSGQFLMFGEAVSGILDFIDLPSPFPGSDFSVKQRIEFDFRMSNSENLSAHLRLQTPDLAFWGMSSSVLVGGGQLSPSLKLAYIDWFVPRTDIMVRMGLHEIDFSSALGSAVLDDAVAGVSISAPLHENVSLTAHWFRPAITDSNHSYYQGIDDSFDVFALTLPVTFDTFSFTPWLVYGTLGESILYASIYSRNHYATYGILGIDNYWFGFNSEFRMFDPLTFKLGFTYASSHSVTPHINPTQTPPNNNSPVESNGWLVDASVSYSGIYGIPTLFAWYASGDDDNSLVSGVGDLGRIGSISASWGPSHSAFFSQPGDFLARISVPSPAGTWGIGLSYDGFQPMEDLTLGGHVMYVQGTNSSEHGAYRGTSFLSDKDSILELAVYADYSIYKDLQLSAGFNYMISDLNSDWFNSGILDSENEYRAYIGVTYTF